MTTQSGRSGRPFQVTTKVVGPHLGRGPAETRGYYRSPAVNKSPGRNPLHRIVAARKLAGLSLIRMRSQVQVLAGPPSILAAHGHPGRSSALALLAVLPGSCHPRATTTVNRVLRTRRCRLDQLVQ